MNAQRVTVNNQSSFQAPDETVLVKGKFYNELREDVAALEAGSASAIAANTANIAINAGDIVSLTSEVSQQYTGALTDGAPTDAEIVAIVGTAAAAGVGFRATIIDNDGTGLVYLVVSDATNWWWTVLTKAL